MALALLLALPGARDAAEGARAAEAGPSLAGRAARFPALRTATADFTQEREVSLVEEVLRSRGTLALAAPDAMRLELRAPEPLTVEASGERITILDAQGKALPTGGDLDALGRFARELADLLLRGKAPGAFRERWTGPDAVTLQATDAASPYGEIYLRFPPDGPLPTRIELVERGGDRTTIHLEAVRLNVPLGDGWQDAPAAGDTP